MTRERLPTRRGLERHELELGAHRVFIDLGRYPDGRLAEVFVVVGHKDGAPLVDMGVALGRGFSLALQHGTDAGVFVHAWLGLTGMAGAVQGHEVIKAALSVPDLIARLVAVEVLGRTDAEIVSPEVPAL